MAKKKSRFLVSLVLMFLFTNLFVQSAAKILWAKQEVASIPLFLNSAYAGNLHNAFTCKFIQVPVKIFDGNS